MEMIPKNNEKFNDFEEKTWKKLMEQGVKETQNWLRRIDEILLRSRNKEILKPKDIKKTTIKCRFGYVEYHRRRYEMDYRRIQGGVKKQPDYIVAFKRNGKIANIEEIIKASKNWEGNLPIVIVDVDECERDQARESKEETREQVVDIQDLEENDNQINAGERQEGISQIKQLYNKLKEVVMKREGANNGR